MAAGPPPVGAISTKKKHIGHVDGVRNVPPNRVLPIDLGKSAIPMESAESLPSGASAVKISELVVCMCPAGRHSNGVTAMTPIIFVAPMGARGGPVQLRRSDLKQQVGHPSGPRRAPFQRRRSDGNYHISDTDGARSAPPQRSHSVRNWQFSRTDGSEGPPSNGVISRASGVSRGPTQWRPPNGT